MIQLGGRSYIIFSLSLVYSCDGHVHAQLFPYVGIPMKVLRLIKTCLYGTYSRVEGMQAFVWHVSC